MSLRYRSFSLFLALRYLRPKRTFLSVITLISIIGVTLGVMVLIVVLAVMTGFERDLEEKVVGFDAHAVIQGDETIADWEALSQQVEKLPDVVGVAPYVQAPVLIEYNHLHLVPKMRAVDPDLEPRVTDIAKSIIAGSFDLDGDKVILGSGLAQMLGVQVGDKVSLFAPGKVDEMLRSLRESEKNGGEASISELKQVILPRDLEVTGIFESGRYLYDSDYLIVPLYIGQEVCDLGNAVNGLSIKTTDRRLAEKVRLELKPYVHPPQKALTWIELNKQFFDAIFIERSVMSVLLFFIIIVAAFGIMNTLITVTVQKTREIGVMKALGARTMQIVGVFLGQGIVVGVFGTLIGLGAGLLIVRYRNTINDVLSSVSGAELLPTNQANEIPAVILPFDITIICLSAFLICTLAALIPALVASRLDPVKALRF